MKIDIEEKEELMYVSVELPAIDTSRRLDGNNREIWFGTTDLITELESLGVETELLKCVQDCYSVHNINEINRKKTWIFARATKSKSAPTTEQTSINASTAKKRSTSKKTRK